jgi:hypothetical protein
VKVESPSAPSGLVAKAIIADPPGLRPGLPGAGASAGREAEGKKILVFRAKSAIRKTKRKQRFHFGLGGIKLLKLLRLGTNILFEEPPGA